MYTTLNFVHKFQEVVRGNITANTQYGTHLIAEHTDAFYWIPHLACKLRINRANVVACYQVNILDLDRLKTRFLLQLTKPKQKPILALQLRHSYLQTWIPTLRLL